MLDTSVRLRVADQVAREFRKQGPSERAAFDRLHVQIDQVIPGTEEWDVFSVMPSNCTTRTDHSAPKYRAATSTEQRSLPPQSTHCSRGPIDLRRRRPPLPPLSRT